MEIFSRTRTSKKIVFYIKTCKFTPSKNSSYLNLSICKIQLKIEN